ncbi:MAG: hypothetical protein F6J93_14545 [Oscillatoria sp. SIO1A7]|nr:hypothetical protein [Oscillatoria sp. SIO1A7]
MTPTIDMQELSLVLAIEDYKPILLNPDFLKYGGIVPRDSELVQEPILTEQMSQISFTNSLNFLAEPGRIIFSQYLEGTDSKDIKVPDVVHKYLKALPYARYLGFAINPGSYVTFEGEGEDAASNYIKNTLLAPGAWRELGQKSLAATMSLTYDLDGRQFRLNVSQVKLQRSDRPDRRAIAFEGHFPYVIAGNKISERHQNLKQLIDNWQADLKTYRDIVNRRFLNLEAPGDL